MFGVPLVATSGVPQAKLIHAAIVMAEYLDNNEDGSVDDPAVVQAMHDSNALVVMFENFEESANKNRQSPGWLDGYLASDLYADETMPSWQTDPNLVILHTIQLSGYRFVHEDLSPLSLKLLEALDIARGGWFIHTPASHPDGAWFHYDREECNRECNANWYLYWGLTSLLGAQKHRCEEIKDQWELCKKN